MKKVLIIVAALPRLAFASDPEEGGQATSSANAGASPPPPSEQTRVGDAPGGAIETELEAAPGFAWVPFGYLRLQYVFVQNDPNVQFVGRDDGFELQNARVGIKGKLGLRAAFQIAFDGAVDERTQINTPQGKLRVGLRDAWLDVRASGTLRAHAGYFQTWVDPEALIPDTARDFVDKPLESRGMRSTQGWYTPGLPPGRSLGVALRLDPATPKDGVAIGFEVGVQNGADEFASNNDNDLPAPSASLVLRLPHDSFVVGSARYNPRTVGDLPFRQDETDLQGSVGAHVRFGAVSIGAGGVIQKTFFESTGGPTQDAFGAHAQVMAHVGSDEQPVGIGYRFGILDPSSLITTDRVMEHTVGAVLGVPSYRMRVQLQITHVQEQESRDLSNDRVQLAAEVSL